MKRILAAALALLLLLSLAACTKAPVQPAGPTEPEPAVQPEPAQEPAPASEVSEPLTAERKGATEFTEQRNAEVYQLLDFDDEQEAEFADRGLLFAPDSLVIQAENGTTIWSQDAYDFVRET